MAVVAGLTIVVLGGLLWFWVFDPRASDELAELKEQVAVLEEKLEESTVMTTTTNLSDDELAELKEQVAVLEEKLEESTVMATTTNLSDAWCSDLARGFSRNLIYRGLMEAYPNPGTYVRQVRDMTREGCPSELESNMQMQIWFFNWDSYGDSLPESWCSDLERGQGPRMAYGWAYEDYFPDEDLFASLAFDWMVEACPEQITNPDVVGWIVGLEFDGK